MSDKQTELLIKLCENMFLKPLRTGGETCMENVANTFCHGLITDFSLLTSYIYSIYMYRQMLAHIQTRT